MILLAHLGLDDMLILALLGLLLFGAADIREPIRKPLRQVQEEVRWFLLILLIVSAVNVASILVVKQML